MWSLHLLPLKPPLNQEWGYFQCTKFFDNYNLIIPIFSQYPIRGVKAKDFSDWVKAAPLCS